jgi:1-deoxy-D-xylulose-5-phosphate reductoisomerase
MKRIVILGSTGSVGTQTLDVVRQFPDKLRVVGLAARRHVELAAQCREFRPRYVAIGSRDQDAPQFEGAELILDGPAQLEELAAAVEADVVVVATVGRAGLHATLAALRAGKTVALANKEVLVMAGHIVRELMAEFGGSIIPVDSEHSALWQCLVGEDSATVHELVLTASGGALRSLPRDALRDVTPAQAMHHPTWNMGTKVTIDSATLMNKGLEVIEARWLFDCPYDRIRVVMHPTSTVHSLVQFVDGSIKAQIGQTDMRHQIQYALSYPERWSNPAFHSDIIKLGSLEFGEPEWERYPCLTLAIEAGKRGGTYPTALCGADEVAVELFVRGSIPFTGIARLVGQILAEHVDSPHPSIEQVLRADDEARARCLDLARQANWA